MLAVPLPRASPFAQTVRGAESLPRSRVGDWNGNAKGALMTGWLWTLITILAPILLIGAIVWAYLRNRNPSREEITRAERGARELREELEEEEARRGEP